MPTVPEPQTSGIPPTGAGVEDVDLTGRTIKGYQIVRQLGAGGMGRVYLAEQLNLKRKVAIKTLKASLAFNPTARQRFKSEAENIAKATHPNIVQVYDIGEFDIAGGIPYIALEYVEGRNLRDYLARKGPPDLMISLSIMRQVASALQRASELGMIHRDIKPDNILLTRKGEAKVTDFGLSRVVDGDQPAVNLTASGQTMGTPLYMAPEQVEGKPVDARTDIYSFGITCYHLFAGHPPYNGSTAFEVALQHVRGEPVRLSQHRPDLPETLVVIVHKMMDRDPAQRYQTCRELLRDLARVRDSLTGATTVVPLDDFPSDSTPATAVLPQAKTMPMPAASGRAWKWLLFLLAALLAAGGGVALSWYVHRVPELPRVQAAAIEPDDADPLKAELALRDGVRLYLNQGARGDVASGFVLARNLGLLYLERGKLKEANELFTELEAQQTVRPYKVLGQLGKAIVLGLRATSLDDAQKSTATIRELFQAYWREFVPRPGGARRTEPENAMWNDPRIRFWASQALWYNTKNGVPASEFPPLLARLRDAPGRQ
jgi:serine/threonine-protein kinase